MNKRNKSTTDGIAILNALFFDNKPAARALVERERRKLNLAGMLYKLRKDKKLTQTALARLIGTTTSVISRIEDADYEGHTFATVERFCQALGYEIHPEFKARMPFTQRKAVASPVNFTGHWSQGPAVRPETASLATPQTTLAEAA